MFNTLGHFRILVAYDPKYCQNKHAYFNETGHNVEPCGWFDHPDKKRCQKWDEERESSAREHKNYPFTICHLANFHIAFRFEHRNETYWEEYKIDCRNDDCFYLEPLFVLLFTVFVLVFDFNATHHVYHIFDVSLIHGQLIGDCHPIISLQIPILLAWEFIIFLIDNACFFIGVFRHVFVFSRRQFLRLKSLLLVRIFLNLLLVSQRCLLLLSIHFNVVSFWFS